MKKKSSVADRFIKIQKFKIFKIKLQYQKGTY